MKKQSIRAHLNEYSIYQKRATTINHAFASAIAENDAYNEAKLDKALRALGQEPDEDLSCFYCDENAETWDHIYGLVKKYEYSGYGHVIGNLIPCCKKCNSEKGNQNWQSFLNKKISNPKKKKAKITALQNYLSAFLQESCGYKKIKEICKAEVCEYEAVKKKIIENMKKADKIAEVIRKRIKKQKA